MSELVAEAQVTTDPALSVFATALRRHDVDFQQSDSATVYRLGSLEYDTLVRAGRFLPRRDVLVLVELRAQKTYGLNDPRVLDYVRGFEQAMDGRGR